MQIVHSDEPKELDKLFNADAVLDGFSSSILTLEAYDETYGIANYEFDDPRAPFALVAMHRKEDYVSGSRMEKKIRAFRQHKIHKHYALSLTEFMELPRHLAEFIMEDCMKAEESDSRKAQELLDGLEGGR